MWSPSLSLSWDCHVVLLYSFMTFGNFNGFFYKKKVIQNFLIYIFFFFGKPFLIYIMTLLKWLFCHIKILCHANAMEYKLETLFSQFPIHCFVALSSSFCPCAFRWNVQVERELHHIIYTLLMLSSILLTCSFDFFFLGK